MQRKSILIFALSVSIIFTLLAPIIGMGKDTQMETPEKIIEINQVLEVEYDIEKGGKPLSFCVSEDNLFFIPEPNTRSIKIFKLDSERNRLKFITSLNNESLSQRVMARPKYCHYNKNKLSVIDFGTRNVLIFSRSGKIDFSLSHIISCDRLSYDLAFSEDYKKMIIPGFVADEENNPYDLYSKDLETGKIIYILPSYEKYGLNDLNEYQQEYQVRKTLPAIGTKAFVDIHGESLYFAWEGALRIIKYNLNTNQKVVFGKIPLAYITPNGNTLRLPYRRGERAVIKKKKGSMSYLTNLFACAKNIFVIYRTNNKFGLQVYTLDGKFQKNILLQGDPNIQMWMNKNGNFLYAFSRKPTGNSGKFSILVYKFK